MEIIRDFTVVKAFREEDNKIFYSLLHDEFSNNGTFHYDGGSALSKEGYNVLRKNKKPSVAFNRDGKMILFSFKASPEDLELAGFRFLYYDDGTVNAAVLDYHSTRTHTSKLRKQFFSTSGKNFRLIDAYEMYNRLKSRHAKNAASHDKK